MRAFLVWAGVTVAICLLWEFVLPETAKSPVLKLVLALILALWLIGVLLAYAREKQKFLSPPTLIEFPPPAGTTLRQLTLLNELFDQLGVLLEYARRYDSISLELFFNENKILEKKIGECLAAGVPKSYLEKVLESRGYLYSSMGAGSGKTFYST